MVVGVGVFALRPMGDFLVIAITHEGTPSEGSGAVTTVVFIVRCAIMTQAERVTELMRNGFGARVVGVENPAGLLEVVVVEAAGVGDALDALIGRVPIPRWRNDAMHPAGH